MTRNGIRFDGKIALVTGGSSGMGLATARRLLAEGAQVIITGRDKARLDTAVTELGDGALGIPGDAADLRDLRTLSEAIGDRCGRLDMVFANAGTGSFQAFDTVTEEEFDRVVAANLKASFFTIQRTLPLLSEGAAVVINASFGLHRGVAYAVLYSATKAAVHNLARTLAAELAPRHIRVNSISPGYTDTPAFRAETSAAAQASVASTVPAGRIGNADEMAAAVAFLASDEATYINGQDLVVDGGLIAALAAAL